MEIFFFLKRAVFVYRKICSLQCLKNSFKKSIKMCIFVFLKLLLNDEYFFYFFYISVTGSQQRMVHVLHNSEQPASVFSLLDTGTKTIPIVADTLFDLLLVKMNNVISRRQRIESRGPRFELCDFCIKIGSVTLGSNFKGILLEVS